MAHGATLQIETFDDIAALPQDVRLLFDAAEHEELQCGADWFLNLTRTVFHQGAAWQVHVLRRNGMAMAAMPLCVDHRGAGHDLRSLGNYYTTLFSLPLHQDLKASELAHLLSHLRQQHHPLRSLSFMPLDPDSRSTRCLHDSLRLAGFLAYDYDCFGNWHLPVSGSASDYLDSRPGEVRSTLRRMGKKFAAAGGRIEILHRAGPADVDSFVQVYRSSWKQPEPYPEFMPGLIRLCSDRGWLRLGLASVGTQPAAAQLWMVSAGKASIYKLAYDPAFKQFSPGSLLTAAMMAHVIDEDRVREVDYLSGDDAYKQAWMSHRRQRIGIVAYNPRSLAGLWGATRQSLGQAARPVLTRLRQRETHPA
jgi:CelD/BcsL family acetyltransferase involved in cellulose biosynthesis